MPGHAASAARKRRRHRRVTSDALESRDSALIPPRQVCSFEAQPATVSTLSQIPHFPLGLLRYLPHRRLAGRGQREHGAKCPSSVRLPSPGDHCSCPGKIHTSSFESDPEATVRALRPPAVGVPPGSWMTGGTTFQPATGRPRRAGQNQGPKTSRGVGWTWAFRPDVHSL